MESKFITSAIVMTVAAAAYGVYKLCENVVDEAIASYSKNATTAPTTAKATTEKGATMNTSTMTDDEKLLASAKLLYADIIATTDTGVDLNEQTDALMAQLIYTHLAVRDCADDVNRTHIDWLRKMGVANPAHYEAIVRKCADNNISTLTAIRETMTNTKTGMVIVSKEQHNVEVADLNKYTTLADITASELKIPTDDYSVKVERVLDIPVVIILTGQHNVVTLKESV